MLDIYAFETIIIFAKENKNICVQECYTVLQSWEIFRRQIEETLSTY